MCSSDRRVRKGGQEARFRILLPGLTAAGTTRVLHLYFQEGPTTGEVRRVDEEDPVPIPYFLDGMAKYFGESDWDVLMKQRADDLWPVFDDLLEEADRRELAVD